MVVSPDSFDPSGSCPHGPLSGEALPLTGPETIIGRDPDSTIVLDGIGVPWRHCSLAGRTLTDLRSPEGTLVNGLRIRQHDLDPGDHITIGVHRFVFESEVAARAPALLEACTMIFLFRALLAGPNAIIERHLAQLLGWAAPPFALNLAPVLSKSPFTPRNASPPFRSSFAANASAPSTSTTPALPPGDDSFGALATLATVALESQLHLESLKSENAILREQLSGIIGQSPNWLRVLSLAQRAAPTEATVLLLGGSGTGKEVIAQAVHRASRRAHALC